MKLLTFICLLIVSVVAKDKIYLDYWTPFSGGDARPMSFIVDNFNNSQNDIVVRMKVIEWGEYYKELTNAITTKTSPDIAIAHASKLSELIDKNYIISLDKASQEVGINWNEFTKNTLQNTIFKSKHYGLPIDTHLILMFYNKKLLNDVHMLNENGDLNLENSEDGFIYFFTQLKNKLPKDISHLGQPIDNVYPFWIWNSFFHQIEGSEPYIKNNKANFNNQYGLKALEFLVKLRDKEIYSKYINDKQAYNMFKYGKSAVFFTGVWATWNFEHNSQLDFGVAPFPKVFDRQVSWSDSHCIVIPKGVSNIKHKAILTFANYIAENGLTWSSAGHIPSKTKILKSKEYLDKTIKFKYAKYLENSYVTPKNPKLWQCNEKMIEIFSNMMQGKQGAKETLQYAEDEINKILHEQVKK